MNNSNKKSENRSSENKSQPSHRERPVSQDSCNQLSMKANPSTSPEQEKLNQQNAVETMDRGGSLSALPKKFSSKNFGQGTRSVARVFQQSDYKVQDKHDKMEVIESFQQGIPQHKASHPFEQFTFRPPNKKCQLSQTLEYADFQNQPSQFTQNQHLSNFCEAFLADKLSNEQFRNEFRNHMSLYFDQNQTIANVLQNQTFLKAYAKFLVSDNSQELETQRQQFSQIDSLMSQQGRVASQIVTDAASQKQEENSKQADSQNVYSEKKKRQPKKSKRKGENGSAKESNRSNQPNYQDSQFQHIYIEQSRQINPQKTIVSQSKVSVQQIGLQQANVQAQSNPQSNNERNENPVENISIAETTSIVHLTRPQPQQHVGSRGVMWQNEPRSPAEPAPSLVASPPRGSPSKLLNAEAYQLQLPPDIECIIDHNLLHYNIYALVKLSVFAKTELAEDYAIIKLPGMAKATAKMVNEAFEGARIKANRASLASIPMTEEIRLALEHHKKEYIQNQTNTEGNNRRKCAERAEREWIPQKMKEKIQKMEESQRKRKEDQDKMQEDPEEGPDGRKTKKRQSKMDTDIKDRRPFSFGSIP